ncbi:uncharacterized protein NPIL_344472 [Nephila pilipes]|uniref:Uncharacterized protein n=1 Tax=Nephila pilipes TaxID=299642 RepID=A0A8X6I8Y5_NEPPI|nr:uncharacterized protein NPIL_344472 [Nephila pilipes]
MEIFGYIVTTESFSSEDYNYIHDKLFDNILECVEDVRQHNSSLPPGQIRFFKILSNSEIEEYLISLGANEKRFVLEGASRKRKHDISETETNSVKHKKSKKQRSKSESETDVDSIVDDEFERNSVLSFKHQRIEKEKIWNQSSIHPEKVEDKYDVVISNDLKKVEDNIPPLSVYIGSGFAVEVKFFHSNVGYILEVDLYYPPELHSEHNSFSMAPHHEAITFNMLSPYQKEICEKLNIKINEKNKKLLNTFNEKKKLCNTDSLCLEVLTDDFYNDLIKKIKNLMNFSNYDVSHKYHSTKHQSLLGYLKDETKGVPIKEFCALRPKMYSYTFGKENKKTAKGTKKSVVQNVLKH